MKNTTLSIIISAALVVVSGQVLANTPTANSTSGNYQAIKTIQSTIKQQIKPHVEKNSEKIQSVKTQVTFNTGSITTAKHTIATILVPGVTQNTAGITQNTAGVTQNTAAINSLYGRFKKIQDIAEAGTASAMAMSAISIAPDQPINIGFGVSGYGSQQAIAVGIKAIQHENAQNDTVESLGASYDSTHHSGVAAGVTWGF